MRNTKNILWTVVIACLLPLAAVASESSLEDQLKQLKLSSSDPIPSGVSREKLYSVQSRLNPLRNKSEISLGFSQNFTGESFLSSRETDLSYRFHFTDRWSLGLWGGYCFNSFTDSAERLRSMTGLVPDVAYPKYRAGLLLGFQPFYGKFRLSMDQVLYFDHYIEAGPGLAVLDTGTQTAAVAGTGFVFWFGKMFNARIGVRDQNFIEKRRLTSSRVNNVMGHLDIGFTLGGEGT